MFMRKKKGFLSYIYFWVVVVISLEVKDKKSSACSFVGKTTLG
jgi:hypothetical protein